MTQTKECPFSGGRAVFKARAYLAIIGDSTTYDDETVCAEDENYRKSVRQQPDNNVLAYPNPLQDVCRFIYSLPMDESAELRIFDGYGQEIYYHSLPKNSVSYLINLGTFTNGIYKYTVYSSSGLIGSGKLVLIK